MDGGCDRIVISITIAITISIYHH